MADTVLWRVPIRVDDVPETGRHIKLSADAATRTAIAAAVGLRSLDRLEATFDVTHHGQEGLHVDGTVTATVGQICVVTLDPIESTISERVDLDFLPPSAPEHARSLSDLEDGGEDPPEVLEGGAVDLGALSVEFLALGVDPYPRKPGAEFVSPDPDQESTGPFAVLEKLKSSTDRKN